MAGPLNISVKPGSVRLTFHDTDRGPVRVEHTPIAELPRISVAIDIEPGDMNRLAEFAMKLEQGFKVTTGQGTALERVTFFHYVTHPNVPGWLARGWIIADTLADTKHGEFAVLMQWAGEGEPPEEKARQAT